MITKELIEQINSLYHKSKTLGLTAEEQQLQAELRQEYLKGIRAQVKNTLEQVKPQTADHKHDTSCSCH